MSSLEKILSVGPDEPLGVSRKIMMVGESFSVYPIDNGITPSLRAVISKEALEDIEICRKLEEFIARDKVIEMIDSAAGINLTFSEYPKNPEYVPALMEKILEIIKNMTK